MNIFWTLTCFILTVKFVGETSENWWSLDVNIRWHFRSISVHFRTAGALTHTIDIITNWPCHVIKLVEKSSDDRRFQAQRWLWTWHWNSRFWMIFYDFRHSFVTCLNAVDGVSYTSHTSHHITSDTSPMTHISMISSCGILIRRHNVNYLACIHESFILYFELIMMFKLRACFITIRRFHMEL